MTRFGFALRFGACCFALTAAGAASAQSDPPPTDPPATDPAQIETTPSDPVPGEAAAPAGDPSRQPTTSVTSAGRSVYDAAYFATFSPSNALEIVQRIPGFSLDIGALDVRGFGQAAGNLVINGARPSSKSDSLDEILARIPANRVARVEVGSGDSFGAEFSGRSQVANLILNDTGGLAGSLNVVVRRNFTGRFTPEANASALYRRGKSTFNLSAGFNNRAFPEEGSDTITRPDGSLAELRIKSNDTADREGFVSGSWALDGGANRAAHLNFRAASGRFTLEQENDVFPSAGPVRDDRLSQDFRRRDYEIGGDISRPLIGGAVKLVGLATRRHRENEDSSLNRVMSQVTGGFAQDVTSQRNETVARLTFARADVAGWNIESGLEGALNSLDSDVNLFRVDGAGGRTRIDLPVDQAKVTEHRGEISANAGRAIGKGLRLDLGLTYEASRLTVSGDASAQRVLGFLKPKAVLDWRRPTGLHVQLSLSRTVSQLNFEDFISAAELATDRVEAGNADLVPQRAWEARVTFEHPILGDGLAKLELGYDRISLLQDRVPTPEGFDAPGNLGTGQLMFARATVDAPLTRLGIKGGRLSFNGTLRDTRVEDPYTFETRSFSGYSDWYFEASFRQDRGKFAWGANVFGSPRVRSFRRNEIDAFDGDEPYLTAFGEYRPSPQTTITLGIDNLADRRGVRERTFFFPDRSNPNPSQFEFRERNAHATVYARLKQSFG